MKAPSRQKKIVGLVSGRDAFARAGRFARNSAVGVNARVLPTKTKRGLLSIIVPFYGVEQYLDDCLRSIRFQHYPNIEIILVDDGSPDRSLSIARAHAHRDIRVRIVRQENQGLSAARNAGAALARGEYITFVDSDDTVRRGAYSAAIKSLRSTGSEFALLGYRRLVGTKTKRAGRWISELHDHPQQRVTIDTRPDSMVNAVAWSKVYRRDFFAASVPPFPVGRLFEDQPVSAAVFAAATSFDILPNAGINWRIRDDRSSISQQEHDVENLRAQLDAGLESVEILRAAGHETAAQIRAEQVLSRNLDFYTDNFLSAGDGAADMEFRAVYASYAERLLGIVGAQRAAQIMPLQQRLIYRLAARVPISDLKVCLDQGWAAFNEHPIRQREDGQYFLDSPLLREEPWASLLSQDELCLGPEDMNLVAGLRNHRFDDGRLLVDGWAYRAGLDAHSNRGELKAWLESSDGVRLPMDVERWTDDRIDERSGHRYVDYRGAGFRASIGLADVAQLADTRASLYVSLDLDGRVQRSRPSRGKQTDPARTGVHRSADGSYVVVHAESGPLTVAIGRTKAVRRQEELRARTPGTLRQFVADDAGFTVRLQMTNPSDVLGFHLEGAGVSVPGTVLEESNGIVLVHFPNQVRRWGDGERPLPSGDYYVRVTNSVSSASRDLWVSHQVGASAPADTLTRSHRVQLRTRNDHSRSYPVIQISAPLAIEERGWRNHQRMVDAYAAMAPSHDGFFFRSLYGEVTNCNGLGLHEEIVRQGIDVPVYWSVKDRSVGVPPGGIGVVEGTEEWHRAIRSSKHVLVNVHQHAWYRKVPGQVMIETFHGYPYKLMGHDWWDFRSFPARQVLEFDVRARDWDFVLSPASYSSALLRRSFTDPAGSEAEYLEIGYPRNDVLFRPDDVARLRARTRERLGIAPEATVVLYAPTFRDYLSADDMTAEFVDLLDVRQVADNLGEDYVILMRGHPFNARSGEQGRAGSACIIDVTHYPDINHLYAASDAAVLDYSSARFDYALTGKPMVFFVPDAQQYHEHRPGLMEFGETAAGPLLSEVHQVVDQLTDLSRLECTHRDARQRVLADFADLDDGKAAARLLDKLGF